MRKTSMKVRRPLVKTGCDDGNGLHLDALLLAELRQRLLDAQRGEPRRSVSVPALPHDLRHHTQSLAHTTTRDTRYN